MRNLYQTCKYFYRKAPYCIVDTIDLNFRRKIIKHEKSGDFIEIYELKDMENLNIWVTKEVSINTLKIESEEEIINILLSRIARSDVSKICIQETQLTFEEYKILTKKVEELQFEGVEILNEDESNVPLENLLEFLPNAKMIDIDECHFTGFKEAIENSVEIPDFPFKIVEAAIKFCYGLQNETKFTVTEIIYLLKFAEQYNITNLKDSIEALLINQISDLNVCQIANWSILLNAEKLKEECYKFLSNHQTELNAINNICLLDKKIKQKLIKALLL